jgi:glycosyltransferase involved in cell wall biosynthesis
MQAAARLRDWIGPLDVWRHAGRVRDLVQQIQPNLVHAMRIPYEGLLAAEALRGVRVPLLLSIWGNDFTLHAAHSPVLAWMTRRALRRADALHPDTKRDLRLARELGFSCEKPGAVLPSAGGIQRDLFADGPASPELAAAYAIPLNQEGRPAIPVVINSRGARSYVRNDTFFQAIPRVLAEKPETRFLCVAMQGNAMAQEWIEKLNISAAVRLLPSLSRQEMAEHFRLATVTVSPSEHDGTPNTLLEAMACGAFPVAGDIESVREWITHEQNGLLCDPGDPVALGYCIVQALEDGKLRCRAAAQNQQLIADHADYTQVMREAERFYEKLAQRAILPVETL